MKYLVATLVLFLSTLTYAQSKSANATTLARGKYLVEDVGLCADCHSPRNQKGDYVREQWLQGAPIMFKPTVPMPWAEKSPNIAGLPGWTEADAIKFLMTGVAYNGLPPNPPMPPYRFSRPDAQAIVAYLKSLGPSSAKKPVPTKKPSAAQTKPKTSKPGE